MALATACQNLGYIYNSRGDYAEASKYFSKAFSLSQAKSNRRGTETSSAHFGVAHTLSMFKGIRKHLTAPGKTSISRIVNWKNQRQEDFLKPLSTQVSPSVSAQSNIEGGEEPPSVTPTAPSPEQ